MSNDWISFLDQEPSIGSRVLVYGNPYPIEALFGIYIADVIYIFKPKLLMQIKCNGNQNEDCIITAPRPFAKFSHWMLLPEEPSV
jgi:hypothetical protein